MSDSSGRDWVVIRLLDLNEQIKAETGIDLLTKSPQSLAIICMADIIANAGVAISDSIGYSNYSCRGGD